jgi:hypothetical protein
MDRPRTIKGQEMVTTGQRAKSLKHGERTPHTSFSYFFLAGQRAKGFKHGERKPHTH